MIEMQFTIRPEQGDASGFDLGDMTVTGELGAANSAGHTPDQGMMIYISTVQLLDSLRIFILDKAPVLSFTGVDTSFNLTVRRNKKGLSIAGKDGLLSYTTIPELSTALWKAAEELNRELPSDDPVKSDLTHALAKFRPLALA